MTGLTGGDDGYDYEVDAGDETLRLGAYRRGVNAYIRWERGSRSGEFGGLTADLNFVFDVNEYVKSGGEGETTEIPDDVAENLAEDLRWLREEAVDEAMSPEEAEAFETDKEVILRAKEILEEEGPPLVSEYETYEFEHDGREVSLHVEARQGVAEVAVETPGASGYSPKYDLSDNVLTLPPSDWGITSEIDVPEGIARSLLDDLESLQKELNDRRKVYDDAVERAMSELSVDADE